MKNAQFTKKNLRKIRFAKCQEEMRLTINRKKNLTKKLRIA